MPQKKRKNYIFHLICMLMLLLVHLDTYGYDFICSLQNSPVETVTESSAPSTLLPHTSTLEWSDPDYRTYSQRQQWFEEISHSIDTTFWSLSHPSFHSPHCTIPYRDKYKSIKPYLFHCLLII